MNPCYLLITLSLLIILVFIMMDVTTGRPYVILHNFIGDKFCNFLLRREYHQHLVHSIHPEFKPQPKGETSMTVKDILVHLEKCGPEHILEVLNEPTIKYLPTQSVQPGSLIGVAGSLGAYQQAGNYIQYAQYANTQQMQNRNR